MCLKARYILSILFLFATYFVQPTEAHLKNEKDSLTAALIEKVFLFGEHIPYHVDIKADVYIHYNVVTFRRNGVMRWVPGMFRFEHGLNEYEGDEHLQLQSRSEDRSSDVKVIAFYSTARRMPSLTARLTTYHTLNIYRATLFTDRLLSPFYRRNKKFYKYWKTSNDSILKDGCVRMAFEGRFHNTQLVEGHVDVLPETGQIRRFSLSFYYDMLHIKVKGLLGKDGVSSCYPTQLQAEVDMKLLGNHFYGCYDTFLSYDFKDVTHVARLQNKYDISSLYALRVDTVGVITDKSYFNEFRERFSVAPDTLSSGMYRKMEYALPKKQNIWHKFEKWLDTPIKPQGREWGEVLFDRYEYDTHSWKITFPPILTPEMFQWSRKKGILFQTKAKMEYFSSLGDKRCSFAPKVGFATKVRQVEWYLPLEWNVFQTMNGTINLIGGGGRRVYSYGALKNIDQINPKDIQPYRDSFLESDFSLSPAVGLKIKSGVNLHRRSLVGRHNKNHVASTQDVVRTIAPHVGFEWTPGQYYYRIGKRKMPAYSHWPTFSCDYEYGWPLGGERSKYVKMECALQYKLDLYALRQCFFYLAGGFYKHQKDYHFIDYIYFNNNNLLATWDDEMSGKFYLLSKYRYNRSPYYFKACSTYESPMLLLSRINFLSSWIQKERIYLSTVQLKHIPLYLEYGYGVSTHIADVSAFMSVEKHQPCSFGMRFVFRLFEDW